MRAKTKEAPRPYTITHTRVCLVWSRKRKPVTDNCPINLRRKLLNHFCHWLEFIANYWTAVYLSCWCGEQKQQQKKSGCAMHFLTLKEVSSCFERRLHYQHKQPIKRNGNCKKKLCGKEDWLLHRDRPLVIKYWWVKQLIRTRPPPTRQATWWEAREVQTIIYDCSFFFLR